MQKRVGSSLSQVDSFSLNGWLECALHEDFWKEKRILQEIFTDIKQQTQSIHLLSTSLLLCRDVLTCSC